MDNISILKILNSNQKLNKLKKEKIFLGVFPRDKIPVIEKYPSCYILNTDPSYKPGEHWLAVYLDENKDCYFFDSYGNAPKFFGLQNEFQKYKNVLINKTKIQGNSMNCGIYCMLFLLYKSHNKLKEFYNEFKNSSFINDRKIINLLKSI